MLEELIFIRSCQVGQSGGEESELCLGSFRLQSARTLTEPPPIFDNCFSMQMSTWLDESRWSTIALYRGPHPGSRHGTDEQLVEA